MKDKKMRSGGRSGGFDSCANRINSVLHFHWTHKPPQTIIHSQFDVLGNPLEKIMTAQPVLELQQSATSSFQPSTTPATRAVPAGSWKLGAGRAMTLRSAEAGILRIAQGRVWATLDGPHTGPANNQGDVILQAGERLTLLPGQRVVIESWQAPGRASAPEFACANEAVYFSWDPAQPAQHVNLQAGTRWQVAVAYPLRDFGQALAMAAHALGRLAWGLAGFGEFFTAGRGRVMPRLESNQP